MKLRNNYFSFLYILTILISSCTSTDDGAYVAPISISEKIGGQWSAISVKQTDELAKAAGEAVSEMGLSRQFSFISFSINFGTDDKNNPTSYTVTGDAPALIPETGYWGMPNLFPNTDTTPNEIYLYSDQAKANKTATLTLSSVPGLLDVFEFKLTRRSNGVAFVSYTYRLCKVNN